MCKVSIITVVWNNEKFIADAINSVLNQEYPNIEYIVVDGASKDGTIDIIKSYGDKINQFISEPDNGLYDAMNKGLKLATGDIVGFINSDDFYADKFVIGRVVQQFRDNECDSVYADVEYVDPVLTNKIVRYYDSSYFSPDKFQYGFMPAHPTFFAKREVYTQFGGFRTDLKIAADFDILMRFLAVNHVTSSYISDVLIKMRMGGISTNGYRALYQILKEQLVVCRENDVNTNIFKLLLKYPLKIKGLFNIHSKN